VCGAPRTAKRSGREQFVVALHEIPDFLERVERSRRNMEALIRDQIALNVVLQIHGLNAEAEPFRRRVAGLGRNGASLAEYVTPVMFKVELPVSLNVGLS
jgi:hypothetical protein